VEGEGETNGEVLVHEFSYVWDDAHGGNGDFSCGDAEVSIHSVDGAKNVAVVG